MRIMHSLLLERNQRMKLNKIIGLVAMAGAFLLAGCVMAPAMTLDKPEMNKITEQVLKTSVAIGKGNNKFCSGNVVYSKRDQKTGDVETLVLTAKHCTVAFDPRFQFEVIVPQFDKTGHQVGDRLFKATRSSIYWSHDLSLVKILDKDTLFDNVAKIGKENIDLYYGREVISVGFPAGMSKTLTTGNLGELEYINAKFGDIGLKYYQRATPATIGGNSGGGLFTKDGDNYVLVGVTSLAFRNTNHMNFFVPHSDVYTYLDRVTKIEIE